MIDNGGGFIFLCIIVSVVGTLEGPKTWDDAKRTCDNKGKILSPVSSVNAPAYVLYGQDHTIWTSNHMLNLGCIPNTDFCSWLYVENVPVNESHLSICYKTVSLGRQSFKQLKIDNRRRYTDSCSGTPSDLIDINDMTRLHDAHALLCSGEKYWIGSFTIELEDRFVRECEIFSKHKNKTKKPEDHLSTTKCNNKYRFSCVDGNHYHTVITMMSTSVTMGTSIIPDKPLSQLETAPFEFNIHHITGIVSASSIIIGLLILGCCLKRWITSMKNELVETLRQKYTHEMYEIERIESEPEVEPETPVSPGGSSLYENINNQNNMMGASTRTVSYMTSRDIQRPVTVPASESSDGTAPRLSLPRRLPSRENAIRQKNGKSRLKLAVKPVRKGSTFSNVPSPDDLHQQQTEVPLAQPHTNGPFFSKPRRQAVVLPDQLEAMNPLCNKPYRKSIGKKPKPSPKPNVKIISLKNTSTQSICRIRTIEQESNTDDLYLNTGHESGWENQESNTDDMYLNTGHESGWENQESNTDDLYLNTGQVSGWENPEIAEDDQNYENIWQNAK